LNRLRAEHQWFYGLAHDPLEVRIAQAHLTRAGACRGPSPRTAHAGYHRTALPAAWQQSAD
jgi:hypothetical protein